METRRRDRLLGPGHLAGLALAVVGVAVSSVSTALAIGAGEVPVTLLPWEWLASAGIVGVVVMRCLGVVALWLAVDRWRPGYRSHALAAAGIGWLLLGGWQAWLMLART